MHTVRIATNPRKWRRPAPCPACRQSRPLILTLGAIYKLRTRKPVNTICATLTTITLALCTALAGCGGMAKASTPAHAVKPIDSQCTDGGTTNGFYECVITLQDTRKVDCIVYAWEKQGGLSCDWSHVSGADKEPAR